VLTAQPKAAKAGGPTAPSSRSSRSSRTGLAYRPALDGLRALAVVAVFAYHARLPWARAGFLGVDVFFVLSGYLITALLLLEHQREGRIDLVRFWCRRARRLLPALIVLLAAVAVAVPLLAQEQAHRLRTDLVAALGYVSNWRLILENQSYFEATGRPPVLQHLWSLAVEEQFYLLWPIALIWLLRRKGRGRGADPRRLVRPLLLVTIASAVLMALLHQPYRDPSRVYYGTDTRAGALLLGAALACATVRWQLIEDLHRGGRRTLDVIGAIGLVALAWAVTAVDEFDPKLYQGGFLAVAAASAAVVAAAARPGSPGPFATVLGSRPLVWLGRRSYAVYLWFWPVLMLTRPHSDVPLSGPPLLALRIALTVALAAVSYRLVERPAHRGALGRVWADIRRARRTGSPLHRPSAAWGLGLAAALVCVGSGVVVSRPRAEEVNLNAGPRPS
jgi:peptidoglycan/LPS O-acetylase OafA/YrhL